MNLVDSIDKKWKISAKFIPSFIEPISNSLYSHIHTASMGIVHLYFGLKLNQLVNLKMILFEKVSFTILFSEREMFRGLVIMFDVMSKLPIKCNKLWNFRCFLFDCLTELNSVKSDRACLWTSLGTFFLWTYRNMFHSKIRLFMRIFIESCCMNGNAINSHSICSFFVLDNVNKGLFCL